MFSKTKRRLKPWLSVVPALLIIFLIGGLIRFKVFAVKKIDCVLDGYPCPLAFEPVLVRLYGQNLLTLKTTVPVNLLRLLDPTLTEVKIEKTLPNRIQVVLKRSPAVAYVVKDGVWFHLDALDNLVALPEKPNLVLPVIELAPGVAVQPEKMSQLVQALNAAPVSFQSIMFEANDRAVIKTTLGPEVLTDPRQPISPTIATLQYILTNLKMGEKLPIKIDLRFAKPILSY